MVFLSLIQTNIFQKGTDDLTLPITHVPYTSSVLFPFFDGLIPEGWLLDIAEQSWKISSRDRMALLLACCKDCIGDSTLLLDYGKF